MKTIQWLKERKEQLESNLGRSKIIIENHVNGIVRTESKMDRDKQEIIEITRVIEILERELNGGLLGNADNPGEQDTRKL